MPKKNVGHELDEEELETGRMAGLIKRKDPQLWDTVREIAKQQKRPVSEVLVDLVKASLQYEMYRDVNGATIMKVMDILDRIYRYMYDWMSQVSVEQLLRNAEMLGMIGEEYARRKGYVPIEEARKILAEQMKEPEKRKTAIDALLDKALERFADRVVERVLETDTGKEIMGLMENIAKKTLEEEGVLPPQGEE